MSEPHKKADWLIVTGLVVAVLLVAVLGVYVGGYFLLSESRGPTIRGATIRVFDAEWKARIYQPMARIETLAAGRKVLLSHRPE
jgi:hypothetical protein